MEGMRRYWPCIFLGLSIFLSGCSSDTTSAPPPEVGANSPQCKQLIKQHDLANTVRGDGVQVVRVGEEITLVLPTKNFFYDNSNNMKNNDKTLHHIVDFINAYPTVNVQVIGYPAQSGNQVRNVALSRAQAEKIAHYLWGNGLGSRLVSADAKPTTYEVHRIEIFFRLPPPTNVFH